MTAAQLKAIETHGRNILAIFPNATERDPVKLCKKLRRLETAAHAAAERECSEPGNEARNEAAYRYAEDGLAKVLGTGGPRVFVNRDPRGYALKIFSEDVVGLAIAKDWGGYGLLAPEFNAKGE